MDSDLSTADPLNVSFRSHLRLVEVHDAEFICSLRSDTHLNKFLNTSVESVAKQVQWIEAYKKRELSGLEYYFVIGSSGKNYGVIRMYDFRVPENSFCWGSWIILPSRPDGLVTFSALMIYELGFDFMGFSRSHFDVRKGNENVVSFHKRSGARIVGEDDENFYFNFERDDYKVFLEKNKEKLKIHRALV